VALVGHFVAAYDIKVLIDALPVTFVSKLTAFAPGSIGLVYTQLVWFQLDVTCVQTS